MSKNPWNIRWVEGDIKCKIGNQKRVGDGLKDERMNEIYVVYFAKHALSLVLIPGPDPYPKT